MNKFVLSALALTTTGGLAVAGTGSEEWLTLDREIESLASTLAPQGQPGVTVSAFIRSSYVNSGDLVVGANDLGGFNMDNIRLSVEGSVGDFSVFVSADGSSSLVPGTGTTNIPFSVLLFGGTPVGGGGSLGVLDAYASWNINEMLGLTMGQFLPRVLGSAAINENHLLFLNHTFNGTVFNARDVGVMLSGQYDMFGFWVSIINGADSAGDELAYALRAEFYAMGGGVGSTVEGAYGSSQGNRLTVGAGYYNDDGNIPDNIAFAVDASFVSGPLSAAAELVNYDDGGFFPDSTPFSAQVGFMFVPDQWEAALRYQDLDTASDTNIITVGLNYYMSGHDAKWQLNYETVDDDFIDLDWFGIGLTASV
ncbi:MAG TPA: porin [Planctomycetota bacterium]|nr:porin [Planctomycetota bacterium]